MPRIGLFIPALLAAPLAVMTIAPAIEPEPKTPSPEIIHFERDVRPIFTQHCLACHGGVKQAADVSFIHRDAALEVVEVGHADDSILIHRVLSTDPYEVMPPPEHGAPLSERQIETLTRWIDQGAKWSQPWAYEPPIAPEIPDVSQQAWCRDPIDRFVMRELDENEIKPSPEATPDQWLRRAAIDLTGLPPSPDLRQRFLNDVSRRGELAYRAAVDRMLADPAYGERWASVWLDQIRYADSKGLGLDGKRNVWKYRDWVIDAINQDMPLDDFTIKQIAGDLLPGATVSDRLATTANRLTQSNEEGGTDDEEFRVEAVLDRVSTVWQTWQGITFGCVQCHSHPYDPIEHDEFYQFAAYFNNTADCDLDNDWPHVSVPLDVADEDRASELDRQIDALRQSVWQRESAVIGDEAMQWQPITSMRADADQQTRVKVVDESGVAEFVTVDTLSKDTTITLDTELPDGLNQLSGIRLTISPRDPAAAVQDSEWGFVLSHFSATLVDRDGVETPIDLDRVIADEPDPLKDPNASLNAKSKDGFAAFTRIHHPRTAVFVVKSIVDVPNGSTMRLRLVNNEFILASFALVTRRGSVAVTSSSMIEKTLSDADLIADRQQLGELQRQRKSIASTKVPAMVELPDHLRRPTNVFIRGLFLTKGDEVRPGVPKSLPPLPDDAPENRLALGKWLVSDQNPLAARVAVNRMWARLFGTGIVATEEDFGSSGEPPSHPELLDHLATQYQFATAWSQKAMLRRMVLSSTYRQDARMNPESIANDPANRLLARGPRFRLPAEVVRDAALSASGLLSSNLHGPPVHPPIPDGVWRPFSNEKWTTPDRNDPDRYRRSIYTYTKRSLPYPMFASFDAPSREFCTPRRLRSNTPLQALVTLNDTTFVECAESLADRMLAASPDLDEQLAFGFIAVTSRSPTEDEIAVLRHVANESMFSVATTLLNLDEITSK